MGFAAFAVAAREDIATLPYRSKHMRLQGLCILHQT